MKILIIAFLLLFSLNCHRTNDQAKYKEKTSESFTSVSNPFNVVNNNPILSLPNSLKDIGVGDAVFHIYLDKNGLEEGANLTFLRVVSNEIDTLRYYNYSNTVLDRDNYPKNVLLFYDFIKKYIPEVEITKKDEASNEQKNRSFIMVSFKLR